jgi:hypothetical protein
MATNSSATVRLPRRAKNRRTKKEEKSIGRGCWLLPLDETQRVTTKELEQVRKIMCDDVKDPPLQSIMKDEYGIHSDVELLDRASWTVSDADNENSSKNFRVHLFTVKWCLFQDLLLCYKWLAKRMP